MSDERPGHVDLFSGLGGFTIAAEWAGFQTLAMCEKDPRCRAFLQRRWGIPVVEDVNNFDGRRYRGIPLLTGGPPCQDASRTGKQRGARGDRWLWPQALRVLAETQALSFVFENPSGILDVGIDGILSEMEGLGYAVQPFDIPACGVGAPHIRHRIWFVGFRSDLGHARRHANGAEHRNEPRRKSRRGTTAPNAIGPRSAGEIGIVADPGCERSGQDEQGRRSSKRATDRRDPTHDMADTGSLAPRPGIERSAQSAGSEHGHHVGRRGRGNVDDAGSERRSSPWHNDAEHVGSEFAPADKNALADTERAGSEGHGRGRMGNGAARRQQSQNGSVGSRSQDLADSTGDGSGVSRGQEPGMPNECVIGAIRQLANSGRISGDPRRRSESSGCETSPGSLCSPNGLHWQHFVWVPCADGKFRRAPDESFDLVNGLHRSLLGALGNSIVPQEAYQILKAVYQTLMLPADPF